MKTVGRLPVFVLLMGTLVSSTTHAHPGAGIAIDTHGQVFFIDTGAGVWKIDRQGKLQKHPGDSFHWLAIDPRNRLTQRDMPRDAGGEFPVVGPEPTLILSSDYPVAVGSDSSFYYPQPAGDRVKMIRVVPGEKPTTLTTLPPILEIGPDGKSKSSPWIHGLAAGPEGSLYYAERDTVRKIAADGTVSLVAGPITVPACERPPVAEDDRLGPALRGLAVSGDGTVYVAASACKAVLKIGPGTALSVVLRAEAAWTPTAVALSGDDLYVLEYWSVKAENREAWIPRVRKLARDGKVTVLATVRR